MMSDETTTDTCAGCIHKTTEYYEIICMECKRFYADQFNDGLEEPREL